MDLKSKVAAYKQRGLSLLETYQALRAEGLQIPWLEVKSTYLALQRKG